MTASASGTRLSERIHRFCDDPFKGAGIGVDTESKCNQSNELGKAFARWFLYTHFGLTYFCPFYDVLERINPDSSRWTKRVAGDLPDYVCGKSKDDVNLLEAKSRSESRFLSGPQYSKSSSPQTS